jgi:hypothetical protein
MNNGHAITMQHAYLSQLPDVPSVPAPTMAAQLSILDYLDAYCDPTPPIEEPGTYFDTKEFND